VAYAVWPLVHHFESSHLADGPQLPRSSPLDDLAVIRPRMNLRSDLAHSFVAIHSIAHGERLVHMQCHRLLEVDILARLNGVDRHQRMPVRR
jgi:hypothetical protein